MFSYYLCTIAGGASTPRHFHVPSMEGNVIFICQFDQQLKSRQRLYVICVNTYINNRVADIKGVISVLV